MWTDRVWVILFSEICFEVSKWSLEIWSLKLCLSSYTVAFVITHYVCTWEISIDEIPDIHSFLSYTFSQNYQISYPFVYPLWVPLYYIPISISPLLKKFFVYNVSVLIASNVHNLDVIGAPPVFCHHRILKQWVEILIQVLTDDLNVIFIVFLLKFFFAFP